MNKQKPKSTHASQRAFARMTRKGKNRELSNQHQKYYEKAS
jgi:hypothetical protein